MARQVHGRSNKAGRGRLTPQQKKNDASAQAAAIIQSAALYISKHFS
jgi:hypothetical protein